MAKVHKVVLYLVDAHGDYDWHSEENMKDEVENALENKLGVEIHIDSVKSSEEFYWDNDLKINHKSATSEDHEEYVKEEN
ncbi:hypothetical protein KAMFAM_160 [Bacillus phage Kamfam]|nr:hypothetical protein OTK52_158 [Bacillus phage OTooleKemple52]AXQ67174.1 hypothetical protein KAMFAM_160 [Bacillus phage Kamfam]